jgi:uncharacterized protein YdeI (YjbR/CyaY-like superfamily)
MKSKVRTQYVRTFLFIITEMDRPVFFSSQSEFRKWLAKNHDKEKELVVGFYKVGTGKPSMTWSESVDQALCFGWIDGVRKSLNEESYTIRFTPRRPNSIWSAINIAKVEELTRARLMMPAGIEAFDKRDEKKSAIYAYEKRPQEFDSNVEKEFRKDRQAWEFFERQPAGYRRLCIHYVMSAKQEKTRTSRLAKLILVSKAGKRL